MDAVVYNWLSACLFWLGLLLVPVGLALVIVPQRILGAQERLNRWISSREFFALLDRPHYKERILYRHHRLTGALVSGVALLCLLRLGLDVDSGRLAVVIRYLADTPFQVWLYQQLYWILLASLVLALLAGLVILVRPSALKRLEAWGNRWIQTDERLAPLDAVKNIPPNVLPGGQPRLFGLAVLAGALYIVYQTAPAVL